MVLRNLGFVSVTSAAIAVGLLACFAYFAYQTGCSADLKTGSTGNVQEAVRLGGISFWCLAGGLIAGCFSIATARVSDISLRLVCAVAFFVFGGVALVLVGAAMEAAGQQACAAA